MNATAARLGRLQKTILRIALQHRDAEGRNGDEDLGADVLSTEAIVAHLELPVSEPEVAGERLYCNAIPPSARRNKAEYLSARASVSTSLRILERRGLVVPVQGLTGWTGANLTPEGVRVARSLQDSAVSG